MTTDTKKILKVFVIFLVAAFLSYLFLDRWLASFIYSHTSSKLRAMANLTSFPFEPLVLPLYILAWLKIFEDHRAIIKKLTAFGTATLVNMTIVTVLKFLISRPRPLLYLKEGLFAFVPFETAKDFGSMPSGHAASCGLMLAFMILNFKGKDRLFCLIPLLGSLLRVLALKHFLSDVIVGLGIGFCLAWFFGISSKTFIEKLKEKLWTLGKIE